MPCVRRLARSAAVVAARQQCQRQSGAARARCITHSLAPGLLHATRLSLERNVVANTLADTPSGYIQDPRASPATMTRYDSLSRVGVAALEAMEREKELLEREELAYPGYTTLRIQELKRAVMQPGDAATTAQLRTTVDDLTAEMAALESLVGQEVEKPLSQERVLLLKWQQRQQRLHDREAAFRVSPPRPPAYDVTVQPDGTEVLERRSTKCAAAAAAAGVSELDDAYLTQPVEMEELPASALVPERTVVTTADVNHVRYLVALGLRRLSAFEEAESILYRILNDDVTHVDAIESLLEIYLGVDGWEPRVRVLFDFLVTEYERAIAEGRLQRAGATNTSPSAAAEARDSSEPQSTDAEAAPQTAAGSADMGTLGEQSAPSYSMPFHTDGAAASTAPTLSSPLARIRSAAATYTTVPQLPPIAVALALLSDIIVEAAAQKCAADGEGATSRFFIEALGPLVRALGSEYAPALLQALFQAVDEQHFMARFDSADVSPAARKLAFSIVIAFLKALTARRIHEMLPNPVEFEFFTLSKLHAALRRADRVHESYHICEKTMQLYRAHSSVYRTRLRANRAAAQQRAALSSASSSASPLLSSTASPSIKTREGVEAAAAMASRLSSGTQNESGSRAESVQDHTSSSAGEHHAAAAAAAAASEGLSPPLQQTSTTPPSPVEAKDEQEELPDLLDDHDAAYREAFFQYVNDRARDSPALGRRLCLEAMQEFPRFAAPWETLALLLHKEDPKKNLADAIIAARHAMLLEPLNLGVIVTLANFYKAASRYELHDRMLDRYRLLVYMAEEGASEEDMMETAREVEALDRETPEAQDLVEETGREMSDYLFRLEQATTYSMPVDKEPRVFGEAPLRVPMQQLGMRPPEVHEKEIDPDGGMDLRSDLSLPQR